MIMSAGRGAEPGAGHGALPGHRRGGPRVRGAADNARLRRVPGTLEPGGPLGHDALLLQQYVWSFPQSWW
jgi:hypothetical protein